MSIAGIPPGLADGLRSSAEGRLLRQLIGAGTWSDDAFSLGRWMTAGTLAGLTFGVIAYFMFG